MCSIIYSLAFDYLWFMLSTELRTHNCQHVFQVQKSCIKFLFSFCLIFHRTTGCVCWQKQTSSCSCYNHVQICCCCQIFCRATDAENPLVYYLFLKNWNSLSYLWELLPGAGVDLCLSCLGWYSVSVQVGWVQVFQLKYLLKC